MKQHNFISMCNQLNDRTNVFVFDSGESFTISLEDFSPKNSFEFYKEDLASATKITRFLNKISKKANSIAKKRAF